MRMKGDKPKPTYSTERWLQGQGYRFIAGIDEAGMSPLAGPVVSAAVIFKSHPMIKELNDSKQLTSGQREELLPQILDKCISYSINAIGVAYIEELNIYHANHFGMQKCIEKLDPQPDYLLIDGKTFHTVSDLPTTWIVKGDTKVISIAAASILAKVTRDKIMCELAEEYPEYGWQQNKGYPTKFHKEAIIKYGVTPHHRINFKGVREYISNGNRTAM
jgi:ribonuclease HII